MEAELGIPKNSATEPDFLGWEVKQHNVANFDRVEAGTITLMTPEPSGGFYKERGPEAFIRKFGYADKLDRADRFICSMITFRSPHVGWSGTAGDFPQNDSQFPPGMILKQCER